VVEPGCGRRILDEPNPDLVLQAFACWGSFSATAIERRAARSRLRQLKIGLPALR